MLTVPGHQPVSAADLMVCSMKKGSVIIDVSIDHGGCFETSQVTNHNEPIYKKHDVIHYCVPNIASRVPHTASIALSNIFGPFLLKTQNLGGISELISQNPGYRKGVISHHGTLTNYHNEKKYGMKYKDLGLILSARF